MKGTECYLNTIAKGLPSSSPEKGLEEVRQEKVPFVFLAALPHDNPCTGRVLRMAEMLKSRGYPTQYVDLPTLRSSFRRLFWRSRLPGCDVVTPLPIPFWLHQRQGKLAQWWKRRLRECIRQNLPVGVKPVVVAATPWWGPVLEDLPCRFLCYDYCDHVHIHAGLNSWRIPWFEAQDRQMRFTSDLILVVNSALAGHVGKQTPGRRVIEIPNGVPSSWLADPAESHVRSASRRPVVGFVGALFEWIDFDLLHEVARALPGIDLALVGPARWGVSLDALLRLPNVRWHGPCTHEEVPGWVDRFDVCLIPFRRNIITAMADPIKLYEYCARGKPVISTVVNTESPMGILYSARTGAEVVTAIQQALDEDNEQAQFRRQAFAQQHTWEKRLDHFLDVIHQSLAEGTSAPFESGRLAS